MLDLLKKFMPFYTKNARYKIAYGGRVGAKSHNIATLLLKIGSEQRKLIVCLREYQKNLEDSVYRLLCNKIRSSTKLQFHYRIMSDKIIGKNGTEFVFSGIKNAKNFKSFEDADIAWIEEAQTISAESIMILIPTIRKIGSELWFSFNPDSEDDPVYDYVRNPNPDQVTIQINYTENLLCPPDMIKEAERMKAADYELYRHVWLGECRTASDAIIYKDRWEIRAFEIDNYFGIPKFNGHVIDFHYGLDFGFVHPCAIVESFRYDGYIYITNEIIGVEMDMDDITTRFINELPYGRNARIFADSARPDLIEGLTKSRYSKQGIELPGLRVEAAKKGAGSVESGITWLKTHKKFIVHPRCQHIISELKKYSYKKTKDDVITTTINKVWDDALDAFRYSYSALIGSGLSIDWEDPEFQKEIHSEQYNADYYG